jgi:hypothetical protein
VALFLLHGEPTPIRHMIRTACTWLLIVLAASPFTAPFSTCDLSALLGSRPSTVLVMHVAGCADIAACTESSDAGSLSPLVGRVVLTRDSILVLNGSPVPAAPETPVLARPASVQYVRALQDTLLQSRVLRI